MSVLVLVLGSSAGGVGRHVAALAAAALAAGEEVHVAGPADTLQRFGLDGRHEDPALAGLHAHPVDIGASVDPVRDTRAARSLHRVLRRLGDPVVHAHGVRAGLVARLAVLGGRPRPVLLVTLHNAVLGTGSRARLGRLVEGMVCRGADAVLGVSGDLVARARRAGAAHAERALVPAPALPPARPRDLVRADLDLAASTRVVLCVARLAPQKDLDVLLSAVARLPDRTDRPDLVDLVDLVVLVAGDGPLRAALSARAAADRLPVRFLGARRDVADLLAAADVVVQTSRWEGQPVFLQEALRAGVAIVATDAGGTAEVTADAAELTPVGDADALATALARLLGDEAARRDLARRARIRAADLPTAADVETQLTRVRAAARARREGTGRAVG